MVGATRTRSIAVIARTLTVDVGPDRVDPVLAAYREEVRPIHSRAAGLLAHYVLADREAGRIGFIGIWESADAIGEVAGELEPARQRLWASFGEAPAVERYEVVDTLRDPA